MRGQVANPNEVAGGFLQGGMCLIGRDDPTTTALTTCHADVAASLGTRSENAGLLGDLWTIGHHDIVSAEFGLGDDDATLGVLFGDRRRHASDCEHCPGGRVPIIGAVVGRVEDDHGFFCTASLVVDWRPSGDPTERFSVIHIGGGRVWTEVIISETPARSFLEPGDTSDAHVITWPRGAALPYGLAGLALRMDGLVGHMRGSLVLAAAGALA